MIWRKFFSRLGVLVVVFLSLGVLLTGFFYYRWQAATTNSPLDSSTQPLDSFARDRNILFKKVKHSLFEPDFFTANNFKNPSVKYYPWTRWWLPGNAIDIAQAKKELQALQAYGFGGVEIQSFTAGLPKALEASRKEAIHSFGSTDYYKKMAGILDEVQRLGLMADLTVGSGWPSGGQHIRLEDGLKTLAFGEVTVYGGQLSIVDIPAPRKPFAYDLFALLENLAALTQNFWGYWKSTETQILDYRPEKAKLIALVAGKIEENKRSANIFNLNDYIVLDPKTLQNITDKMWKQRKIRWEAPPGVWRVVAVYAMPDGENPILNAQAQPGYVVDHLDSAKVIAHLNYLLGSHTQLDKHYGKTVRAIFNDSFEFKTERHYASGLIDFFKQRRGYDITPYLPALAYPGYDNFFMDVFGFRRGPEFILNAEEARIRYDYSLTVSEWFAEQFMKPVRKWAEQRGLLSRVQAYGMEMDVIKAAGLAHIPETEQLYAGGSSLFLKIASSGAHLYNCPVVSAEAVVFQHQDYATTPAKTKLAVDKLFYSGVNHVVFHGTPHQNPAFQADFGALGWFPFSSPYGLGNFSSNFSPKSQWWSFQYALNQYISRCQFALRQGKPEADVLIYYPYLGFSSGWGGAYSHQEFMFNGQVAGVERQLSAADEPMRFLSGLMPFAPHPRNAALAEIWKMTQAIEAQGLTWDWANDEVLSEVEPDSLRRAHFKGHRYRMVVVPHQVAMQPTTAENLAYLTKKGVPVLLYGEAPRQQPGFFQYKQNDKRVREAILKLLDNPRGRQALSLEKLTQTLQDTTFVKGFWQFETPSPTLKYTRRALYSGEQILFLSNTATTSDDIAIRPRAPFKQYFWLDPMTGKVYQAKPDKAGYLRRRLEKYESTLLLCGQPDYFLDGKPTLLAWNRPRQMVDSVAIQNWKLTVPTEETESGVVNLGTLAKLVDWRTQAALKYLRDPGIYVAEFDLNALDTARWHFLDLGEVYFTAQINLNGQNLGQVWHYPYRKEVSQYLKKGKNRLEITVKPSWLNYWIGQAKKGSTIYKHFRRREQDLLPAGLLGPVWLQVMR